MPWKVQRILEVTKIYYARCSESKNLRSSFRNGRVPTSEKHETCNPQLLSHKRETKYKRILREQYFPRVRHEPMEME